MRTYAPKMSEDLSPEPVFSSAAERIVYNKRTKFERKHGEPIKALSVVGHVPEVRAVWITGEGGGARVTLVCEGCGMRRHAWLPERWQRLSPQRGCH
jgi:hypothetical protein